MIYKYMKINHLEDVLKTSSFMMGNPLSYNDPFECTLNVDEANMATAKSLDIDCVKLINLKNYMFSNKGTFICSKTTKQKFKEEYEQFVNEISKNKMYRPFPNLNFYYQSIFRKDNNLKEKIESVKQLFETNALEVLKKSRRDARLCCFTTKNNNTLMWSHYANAHEGVCIGIEEDESIPFRNVEYSKERAKYDLCKITSICLYYWLVHDKLGEISDDILQETLTPLFVKSYDWSYEKEIRYYWDINKENKVAFKIGNDMFFKPGKITCVYLGCKMNEEDEASVRKLCRKYNVPAIKMKIDDTSFNIMPQCLISF